MMMLMSVISSYCNRIIIPFLIDIVAFALPSSKRSRLKIAKTSISIVHRKKENNNLLDTRSRKKKNTPRLLNPTKLEDQCSMLSFNCCCRALIGREREREIGLTDLLGNLYKTTMFRTMVMAKFAKRKKHSLK
ncbi:deoxyhypusine hydroxylase-like [Sarcoptes scabiei]|nr:deoxyhypusine hydroxylase-like [Sarcoptes scabiei]